MISRRGAIGVMVAAGAGTLLAERPSGQVMLSKTIPVSGEKLPVIGLGTWQTFDVGSSEAARKPLRQVLRRFVELGGKVIDSSPMYGRSEKVVGELASKLKLHPSLFLATKVWTSGKQAGLTQMQNSMREMETTRMDLMQVHNLVDVSTHLATLREWKRAGRIRYLGITHYHSGAYDQVESLLRREQLDFLQINYSVAEREAEKRLLPLAKDRGVAVIANRPFAGGALFGRVRGKPVPGWAGDIECSSWAQLFLKFIVSHPAMTCAIPGTDNPAHIEDNMRGGFGIMPDPRQRARIVEALSS